MFIKMYEKGRLFTIHTNNWWILILSRPNPRIHLFIFLRKKKFTNQIPFIFDDLCEYLRTNSGRSMTCGSQVNDDMQTSTINFSFMNLCLHLYFFVSSIDAGKKCNNNNKMRKECKFSDLTIIMCLCGLIKINLLDLK